LISFSNNREKIINREITFNHNHTIFSKELTNLEGFVDGKDDDDDEADSLKENKTKEKVTARKIYLYHINDNRFLAFIN
jgi:hypothetical protein